MLVTGGGDVSMILVWYSVWCVVYQYTISIGVCLGREREQGKARSSSGICGSVAVARPCSPGHQAGLAHNSHIRALTVQKYKLCS